MSLTDTFDNPQSRVEAILQNAMGAEHEVVPQSRVEELLERLDGYLENIEGKITDQDEEIIAAVNAWLEDNPEATTTVQDGSINESKLSPILLSARLKYKYISGETLTPINGDYIYENCNINDISTETTLTGTHIFYNCAIGTLFIRGGEYEFHNCNFEYIRLVNSTGRFFTCIGTGINLTGACHNSIVDGCKLTASEEHGTLVISGSISDNVKICNNTIINLQSTTLTGVELNCINTHGISNSIIENNYCETDTERTAIDVSGHGDAIRSFNNVVRNNTCVIGYLTIYAAKNIKVENNHLPAIFINGEFLEQDYGYLIFTGNIILSSFNFRTQRGSPTSWNVYIYGNICFGTGINTYYDFSDNIKIYFVGNTIVGGNRAVSPNDYGKKVILPQRQVYVLPGETVRIPPCQVISSELSDYPAGTIYQTWTTLNNSTSSIRYIVYSEIRNGTAGTIWSQ